MAIAPFAFSHIVNFSARAFSGTGSDTLIVGFVVSGKGKNFLVRGIGPSLALFRISDFLPAPILTLFNSDGTIGATDSGWQTDSSGQNGGPSLRRPPHRSAHFLFRAAASTQRCSSL